MDNLTKDWKIIRNIILYTTNKSLALNVTYTFIAKVFSYLNSAYGSKPTIRHQYNLNEIPRIRELIINVHIFTFVTDVEILLKSIINNYIHDDLYILDSGYESWNSDLEDA